MKRLQAAVLDLRCGTGVGCGCHGMGASLSWNRELRKGGTTEMVPGQPDNYVYYSGGSPLGVAFDGANIWVVNFFSMTVSKLRAADGTNLGISSVSFAPSGVTFDGANIWVTNGGSNTVSKLRAADGVTLVTHRRARLLIFNELQPERANMG